MNEPSDTQDYGALMERLGAPGGRMRLTPDHLRRLSACADDDAVQAEFARIIAEHERERDDVCDSQRDPEDAYLEVANAIAAATRHEQLDRVGMDVVDRGLMAPWLIELGKRKRAELTAAIGPSPYAYMIAERVRCVIEITYTHPDMAGPHTTTIGSPDPIAVAKEEFGSSSALDELRQELRSDGYSLVSVVFRDPDSGAMIVITEKEWN